jgi:hypothetical protein
VFVYDRQRGMICLETNTRVSMTVISALSQIIMSFIFTPERPSCHKTLHSTMLDRMKYFENVRRATDECLVALPSFSLVFDINFSDCDSVYVISAESTLVVCINYTFGTGTE